MPKKTKRSIQWVQKQKYLGIHFIAEFWNGKIIEDSKEIEKILITAVKRAKKTPLEVVIYKFSPQGIAGIVLLAESHIALHSWPEFDYLAIDIFTCGEKALPQKALEYLKKKFKPKKIEIQKIKRGKLYEKERRFLFRKNWFFEDFLPGEPKTSSWGFQIEKELYSGKSRYQKIEVFDTKEFGRVLVLDGLIQFATKDEFVYHEMLVHPALIYHSNPKIVLIIGGGDGPALREVLKYPVKEVFLVDIDRKVTEVSKKYFQPILKGAFNDKRVKIFNEDALKFIKRYDNFFDVIIEDLTDPTGPSECCWSINFYRDILQALKEDGVAGFQSGYLKGPFAKKARRDLAKVFPFFKIHRAFVGCFPLDEHTFSFSSKKIDFNKVSFKKIKEKYKKLNLKTKYYSPEIHFASQVLPPYLK